MCNVLGEITCVMYWVYMKGHDDVAVVVMSVLENLLWWYLFKAISPVRTSATKLNMAKNPITCKW